ncbi:MAG: hypothetical protein GYB68_00985 [Chloroflexi bacterium]|nr:hypothetical protein [Chloroflexota bacterium]
MTLKRWSLSTLLDLLQEESPDPERHLRLLACDFAERSLSLYQQLFPDDEQPRRVLILARQLAQGQAERAALDEAWEMAEAIWAVQSEPAIEVNAGDAVLDQIAGACRAAWDMDQPARQAAQTAADDSAFAFAYRDAYAVSWPDYYPGETKSLWQVTFDAAHETERAWQRKRAIEVLLRIRLTSP